MVKKTRVTLSNGLPLVVVEIPHCPAAAVSFWVKAGTRMNPAGKEGLAHFFEHLLLKKTKKYPADMKFAEVLERMGAWKNAWTTSEYMNFLIDSRASDIDKTLSVLGEVINRPFFDQEGLDKERKVIEKEQIRKESNPEDLVLDVMRPILLTDSSLAASTLGTKESIRKIALADVEKFWQENYLLNNSLVCVSGGIKAEEVIRESEKLFTSFRRRNRRWVSPIFSYQKEEAVIVKKKELPQVIMELAFRTEPGKTDQHELEILRTVLCRGWSSRLVQRLRVKEGLIYYWESCPLRLLDTGAITFVLSTSKAKFPGLVKATFEEIGRIRDEGISSDELERAKGYIAGTLLTGLQTAEAWLNWYAPDELLWPDKVESPEEFIRKIQSINQEDVLKIARKYLTNNNWYLAVVGDVDKEAINVDGGWLAG